MEKFVTSVLGCQWGDEGKGKLIDILSKDFDIIARATGGANAGHTVYIPSPQNPAETQKFVFHLLPSGILNEHTTCVIGNGVVLHLETLFEEIRVLNEHGIETNNRILISDRAHLVFDFHKIVDGLQEDQKGTQKIDTTRRGIGPTYGAKIARHGLRLHHLKNSEEFKNLYLENLKYFQKIYNFDYSPEAEIQKHFEYYEKIKSNIIDSSSYLSEKIENGKKILIEGANGALLDIDHGTYPFVTSSNSTIGGLVTGLGLKPQYFQKNIGIFKAYTTRVGAGPFPTELHDENGEKMRVTGHEYGSTTGRPRRCGWFDAVVAKYAIEINGITEINLTKLDILTGFQELKIATNYQSNEGEKFSFIPANTDLLEEATPEYITLPGWQEDISQIKIYQDLPENTKRYIETLEEILKVKITSLGTGEKRFDIIFR